MKLKIDNDAIAEAFFEDSILLGIVAPIKDYQFSWQLNQVLGFNFRLKNDLEIVLQKKNRQYYFHIYEYNVPSTTIFHYLYNNQYDGEYLLPEFKHLDFLLLIKGYGMPVDDQLIIIPAIKNLASVQLITEMTNEKIKHKQHLML